MDIKKILTAILCICLMVSISPMIVSEAIPLQQVNTSIVLGFEPLITGLNTENAATVFFGKKNDSNLAWKVIGYNDTGVAPSEGFLTLFSVNGFGTTIYSSSSNQDYGQSDFHAALNNETNIFSQREEGYILRRDLATGVFTGNDTDCVSGNPVDGQMFWPLSVAEANQLDYSIRRMSFNPDHQYWAIFCWWLRSPGSDGLGSCVSAKGNVLTSGPFEPYEGYDDIFYWLDHSSFVIRPAFYLSSDSILFIYAADGGKASGDVGPNSLKRITEYEGNEWKMTLLDGTRYFKITDSSFEQIPGDQIEIHYTDAVVDGPNEYISAIIMDMDAKPLYYGRVFKPEEESGSFKLTVPSLEEGEYIIKIFNEQYDEEEPVSYSSTISDVSLSVKKAYTAKFVDQYERLLYKVTKAEGSTPEYEGPVPTKASTAQYTYTFAGWTPEIVPLTENVTYKATFSHTVNEYTINFVNEDGTELQSSVLAYGKRPAYTGEVPVKESDDEYDYVFTGWAPEITPVKSDMTYQATFDAVPKGTEEPTEPAVEHTVVWLNEDGSVLDSKTYNEGDPIPEFPDVIPEKEEDDEFTYEFEGWEIASDEDNTTTYKPVFTAVEKEPIHEPDTDDTRLPIWIMIMIASISGMIAVSVLRKKKEC